METKHLIKIIVDGSKATGLSPNTITHQAVGNGRLLENLKNRVRRDKAVARNLEKFIAKRKGKKCK